MLPDHRCTNEINGVRGVTSHLVCGTQLALLKFAKPHQLDVRLSWPGQSTSCHMFVTILPVLVNMATCNCAAVPGYGPRSPPAQSSTRQDAARTLISDVLSRWIGTISLSTHMTNLAVVVAAGGRPAMSVVLAVITLEWWMVDLQQVLTDNPRKHSRRCSPPSWRTNCSSRG